MAGAETRKELRKTGNNDRSFFATPEEFFNFWRGRAAPPAYLYYCWWSFKRRPILGDKLR